MSLTSEPLQFWATKSVRYRFGVHNVLTSKVLTCYIRCLPWRSCQSQMVPEYGVLCRCSLLM